MPFESEWKKNHFILYLRLKKIILMAQIHPYQSALSNTSGIKYAFNEIHRYYRHQ